MKEYELQATSEAVKEEPKFKFETPVLEKQEGLLFPQEIWESFNNGNWCFGCTNCHGCN